MEKIYPVYRKADIVVLTSPLYYWNLSGQLRTASNCLFAVAECNNYCNPQKEAALLMVAEGNGFEESVYDYSNLTRCMGWKDLGRILVGGVTQPGDILGNPGLEKAFQLGASIQ